jgi:hypothetical protein
MRRLRLFWEEFWQGSSGHGPVCALLRLTSETTLKMSEANGWLHCPPTTTGWDPQRSIIGCSTWSVEKRVRKDTDMRRPCRRRRSQDTAAKVTEVAEVCKHVYTRCFVAQ